jgi:hypothetical protein
VTSLPTARIASTSGKYLYSVLSSLGTAWGLFRHYWVLAKLLLTVLATVALLVHTQLIDRAAGLAGQRTLPGADLGSLKFPARDRRRCRPAGVARGTALSVYKPRGVTAHGWRKQQEQLKALQRSKQDEQRTALEVGRRR